VTDLALSAGYGCALSENISAGAGLKLISESIEDISGRGFVLDLGVLCSVPAVKGLSLAAAAQNIGPAVKFQGVEEKMPFNLRVGAAYAFNFAGRIGVAALDLTGERSENVLAGFGVETIVAKSFPVRLGYLYNNFSFDYAFVPFKELGATHRFSATMFWGQ